MKTIDIQQLNEPPRAKPLQAAKSSIQSGQVMTKVLTPNSRLEMQSHIREIVIVIQSFCLKYWQP